MDGGGFFPGVSSPMHMMEVLSSGSEVTSFSFSLLDDHPFSG